MFVFLFGFSFSVLRGADGGIIHMFSGDRLSADCRVIVDVHLLLRWCSGASSEPPQKKEDDEREEEWKRPRRLSQLLVFT